MRAPKHFHHVVNSIMCSIRLFALNKCGVLAICALKYKYLFRKPKNKVHPFRIDKITVAK